MSAASKFPLNVVLPFGVAAPAAGFATVPATTASTGAAAERTPCGSDNRAVAAGSNEYGGPAVAVAASTRVDPVTLTPAPVSNCVPPHVTASSNFLPVGTRWRTNASDWPVLVPLALASPVCTVHIGQFAIEKWKISRAKQVAQSTVNRELNVVKALLSRAVEWKKLPVSPAQHVRKFDVDDARIRVLNPEEIAYVLTHASPDIALISRVTLECLLRLSEVLGLRREHIGSSWIEMRRKGGAVERIPITPELRTALLAHAHQNEWVFGDGDTGKPPTQAAVSVAVTRLTRRLKLRGVSHHTMRHTGITLMLEAGANPRAIEKLAGWTSLRMLERYGHVRDAELRRAVRVASTFTVPSGSHHGSHDASAASPESPQVVDSKWRPQCQPVGTRSSPGSSRSMQFNRPPERLPVVAERRTVTAWKCTSRQKRPRN
jgi:integrase